MAPRPDHHNSVSLSSALPNHISRQSTPTRALRAAMGVEIPLAQPPDGVIPDFYSLAPLQMAIIATGATTIVLATILLIIRLYTSIYLVKKIGWDVLFIVLAWLTALGFFGAVAAIVRVGLGRHHWDVALSQVPSYMAKVAVTAVMYMWPLSLAKLSLLVVYHRINPEMVFKYCVYIVAVVVLVPTIVYMGLALGPCNPGINPDRIQCIYDLGVLQATTNIVTDLILIAMPLYMVRTLDISRRKKIVLGCLMGFGSSVVTFSILRTCFLQAFIHNPDFTYHHGVFILTSILEVNFGVICACLPLLQPFLKQHLPRLALKISDTAKDNERDNRRRNERALHAGLGHELTVLSIGARLSPRRWRLGIAGGDGAGGYVLHGIGKSGDTKDTVVSVDTGRSSEVAVEREKFADPGRLEGGRGLPLLPDPIHVIHQRRETGQADEEWSVQDTIGGKHNHT